MGDFEAELGGGVNGDQFYEEDLYGDMSGGGGGEEAPEDGGGGDIYGDIYGDVGEASELAASEVVDADEQVTACRVCCVLATSALPFPVTGRREDRRGFSLDEVGEGAERRKERKRREQNGKGREVRGEEYEKERLNLKPLSVFMQAKQQQQPPGRQPGDGMAHQQSFQHQPQGPGQLLPTAQGPRPNFGLPVVMGAVQLSNLQVTSLPLSLHTTIVKNTFKIQGARKGGLMWTDRGERSCGMGDALRAEDGVLPATSRLNISPRKPVVDDRC